MKKPKSEKWYAAMASRRGKGTNQFTKNPGLKMSEETKSKISKSSIGRKHTEETKSKISKSRKEYLIANPDKVPYLVNHYSKGPSYPEKYFSEIFENFKIEIIPEFRIHLYSLDFAIPEKQIDIEKKLYQLSY